MQNILKLSLLKESFNFEKLAAISLQNFLKKISLEPNIKAPAMLRAYLMQKYGFVLLKSSVENLQKNAYRIHRSAYPYLLTKAQRYSDYMLCSMRQCFAKEKSLQKIMKKVVEYEKYMIGK